MISAIYVRVSTDRQALAQTIDQQIERLRLHLKSEGQELHAEHIFRDDGYSRSYAAARTRSRAGNASCRPWRMRRRLSCRQVHPWSRRSRSTSKYATRHKAI